MYFGPDLIPFQKPLHLKIWIIVAIVSGLIPGFWIIGRFTFVLHFFRVSNASNEPTLRTGQFFFTSNLKKPGRFRFICYRVIIPESGPSTWVHRLCGVPGDTVEIKAGVLFVNGKDADKDFSLKHVYKINSKDIYNVDYDAEAAYTIPPYGDIIYVPLADKYIRNKTVSSQQYILPPGLRDEAIFRIYRNNWNQDNFGPLKVPPGKFFVLGDNRVNDRDSRYHGMIDQSQYLATVLWK